MVGLPNPELLQFMWSSHDDACLRSLERVFVVKPWAELESGAAAFHLVLHDRAGVTGGDGPEAPAPCPGVGKKPERKI